MGMFTAYSPLETAHLLCLDWPDDGTSAHSWSSSHVEPECEQEVAPGGNLDVKREDEDSDLLGLADAVDVDDGECSYAMFAQAGHN